MVEQSFFITNLRYIFSNVNVNGDTGHLLTKSSNFVQFNNEKHLLQCKVEFNNETIKIKDG